MEEEPGRNSVHFAQAYVSEFNFFLKRINEDKEALRTNWSHKLYLTEKFL